MRWCGSCTYCGAARVHQPNGAALHTPPQHHSTAVLHRAPLQLKKKTTFKQQVAHNPVEKEAEAQNKEGDDVRPTTGSSHAFLQEPGRTKHTHKRESFRRILQRKPAHVGGAQSCAKQSPLQQ
ncbi:hypothetical protein DQ04_10911030 [Trypanosoma grayi]|uniref:hypothetical protein n=1 Tax=Trypanosoma grayi TaxID=71804 RepID=UPI0004F41959|nr:hypothetical protein DQ04_10911030 [Trypanosoma grayi]KEG07102.1 hypothetical protein DQ04_10911030 [Trypanosoma grayi]